MLAKKLKFGDTIGVICPASGDEKEKITSKIELLKSLGFNVKIGEHVYDKYGYLAGKDIDRAFDINSAFQDPSIDAIMCYRGGYGTMRMLPYVNFNLLKSNPKIFIGYSDITTLLNHVYRKNNLITFHGPMANSELKDDTLKSLLDTLMNGDKPFSIKNPDNTQLKSYGSKSVSGIIVGGNLSLICATIGTPYEINFKDKILFIEEISEEPYSIDRMLCQLTLSNKLQQCAGFILGQFKDCSNGKELSLECVLEHYIFSLNKPVIYNFMCGHNTPNLTLPIGAKATLDISGHVIEILEPIVK
ncbi:MULTISPECIES: S66 peptidase family protein [Clostridium]|uniref:LD-carboxypeptidase n=1 Tax=Clostridium cadaveris TaxID=1529 RepID=A0A1I2Q2H0_9CLOT|nr:LD-carboxypeptidase [Clostridium cadaveris]MDU4953521.1 LD-carboxypeptidase [Clostridium sp.]MDM8311228.1 LD-carboxypeptidase [Clostridium cadaveris]MDY4947970.1 LD-carboxypeptidase [Clostridium cadaveris]NME66118.1 LD-carboxypeptidase [Clostridium cadaveris]NWK12683.1 LD-carboxypeptidase [Clostridium cadaveris]